MVLFILRKRKCFPFSLSYDNSVDVYCRDIVKYCALARMSFFFGFPTERGNLQHLLGVLHIFWCAAVSHTLISNGETKRDSNTFITLSNYAILTETGN